MQVKNNLNQTKSLGLRICPLQQLVLPSYTMFTDGKQSVNAGPHHADDDHPDGQATGAGWKELVPRCTSGHARELTSWCHCLDKSGGWGHTVDLSNTGGGAQLLLAIGGKR